MASVRDWSDTAGFEYRFYGDEIFELVPDWYQQKAGQYLQISTDFGRLALARQLLNEGYDRVIWLDADVLIFDPKRFVVNIIQGSAFGREVWVQRSADGQLKAYKNVHNAVCCFCQDATFLDFYMETCLSMLGRSEGGLPPQIVGTKLLTALHNIVGFQLIESIGMASPLVLNDIAMGTTTAIDLLLKVSQGPLYGANLCASLVDGVSDGVRLDSKQMDIIVNKLQLRNGAQFNV